MIYVTVLVGVLLISVLLAPFGFGSGGLLQASSSINSKPQLVALKEALLKRYLEDEAQFKSGNLSNLAWQQRKSFLTHRYIDASRRLDYLEHAPQAGGVV